MGREDARYERGLEALRTLLGRDRGPQPAPEEPPSAKELHRIFLEHCYGDSWARPGLDMKTKALVTVAVLATLGAERELKVHIRGAHNMGATKDELVDLLIHIAAYSGTPRAVHATTMAREVWREMDAGRKGQS